VFFDFKILNQMLVEGLAKIKKIENEKFT